MDRLMLEQVSLFDYAFVQELLCHHMMLGADDALGPRT